jgi:glutamate transport system substrate-binding protein
VTDEADEPAVPGPDDRPVIRSRRSAMAVRLVAVTVTLVLALWVGFAVVVFTGPPSEDALRRQAGLDGKRELLIGVKDDQPGVAYRKPDGSFAGFDIDIAYMVAAGLGFRRDEVRFLSIESEDRARMQATDAHGNRIGVDLVVASYSITPERKLIAGVRFSAPYLYTEQSVVTLAGHRRVSTLEDLRGERVCSLATSTSALRAAGDSVATVNPLRISGCFDALAHHQVDAVTTDAAILGGFVAEQPTRLRHWDIGNDATEAWGINVGDNPALQTLVNLILYRSRNDPADSRWEEAYDRNLRVEQPKNPGAPLAVDVQPAVPEPKVRQWPWQRA